MKTERWQKAIMRPILIPILSLLLSGCVTSSVISGSTTRVVSDEIRFLPRSLSVDEVTGDWAIQGRFTHGPHFEEEKDDRCLIFPKLSVDAARKAARGPFFSYFLLATHEKRITYSVSNFCPPRFARHYESSDSGFYAVTNLIPDSGLVSRKELTSVSPKVAVLLPGALALDVVTAPLQVVIYQGMKQK